VCGLFREIIKFFHMGGTAAAVSSNPHRELDILTEIR